MDQALRAELTERFRLDQDAVLAVYANADQHRATFEATHPRSSTPWPYAVFEWEPEHEAPNVVQRALARVRENTDWLMRVVDDHGWPGRHLVGEEGADAAWLLLQHAGSGVSTLNTERTRSFRRSCVPLLREAVDMGRAHPRHLAHTVDGIRSVEGDCPIYGVLSVDYEVQDGLPVFRRSVDLAVIDDNRRGIGLRPLMSDVTIRARGEAVPVLSRDGAEPWLDKID